MRDLGRAELNLADAFGVTVDPPHGGFNLANVLVRAIEVLGLLEREGVTRLGISLYNTEEEVNFAVAEIKKMAG